jgi:hypothetical protein
LVIDVTTTFAPATALPCASVTVPTTLPKTAWPDAWVAVKANVRPKTTNNPSSARLLIPPLLI